VKYVLLAATSIPQLEAMVNNEIGHGWIPTGGLCISTIPSKEMLAPPRTVFVQAMILTDHEMP